MSFPNVSLFRQDRWKATQFLTERLDALQELEIKLALDEGRKPCEVKFWPQAENSLGLPGEFRVNPINGAKEIRINPAIVEDEKPYKAVETQLKCSRQAYQEHAMEMPLGETPGIGIVSSWKSNKAVYINHPGNTNTPEYAMHRFQPLEVDKSNAAYDGLNKTYLENYTDADYLDYRSAEVDREQKDRSYAEDILQGEPGNSAEAKVSNVIEKRNFEHSMPIETDQSQEQTASFERSGGEPNQSLSSEAAGENANLDQPIEQKENNSESDSPQGSPEEELDQDESMYYGYGL